MKVTNTPDKQTEFGTFPDSTKYHPVDDDNGNE